MWTVSGGAAAFKRSLAKEEGEDTLLSRCSRAQKAAVEEMSSVNVKERDKGKSKARIEQNIEEKKFKGSRGRP